jgi:hypothetical protein
MTPEELDRKIEFIIETQAHFWASLDREREQREYEQREQEKRLAESERMQKTLAGLQAQVVNLIRIESERLDRSNRRLEQVEKQSEEAQRRNEEILQLLRRNEDFQRNALAVLGRILDRLPPLHN